MAVGFQVKARLVCALAGITIGQLGGGGAIARGASPAPAPALTKPGAPSGLKDTVGNGRVGLTWNATSGATSYHVKRATKSGGPYTTIATTTYNGYTNVSLSNGTATSKFGTELPWTALRQMSGIEAIADSATMPL